MKFLNYGDYRSWFAWLASRIWGGFIFFLLVLFRTFELNGFGMSYIEEIGQCCGYGCSRRSRRFVRLFFQWLMIGYYTRCRGPNVRKILFCVRQRGHLLMPWRWTTIGLCGGVMNERIVTRRRYFDGFSFLQMAVSNLMSNFLLFLRMHEKKAGQRSSLLITVSWK